MSGEEIIKWIVGFVYLGMAACFIIRVISSGIDHYQTQKKIDDLNNKLDKLLKDKGDKK